jgi:transposase
LHEVKKRHITQKQAAAELGLSVRWVRELLLRLRAGGDAGLRHGLRGRRSNRKTSETVKQRAVELYRQKKQAKLWHDYGPTLAVEELAEEHGIAISRETLRQWLIEAKLWRARVVQDSIQMIQQHPRQLLHRLEPLPAQLVDPAL